MALKESDGLISGVCRRCGCTDDNACPGGCAWEDEDHTICSSCVDEMGVPKKPVRRRGRPAKRVLDRGNNYKPRMKTTPTMKRLAPKVPNRRRALKEYKDSLQLDIRNAVAAKVNAGFAFDCPDEIL